MNPEGHHDDRNRHLVVLNQIAIASPCGVEWSGMSGTERARHCSQCGKQVHNLVEHTSDEALRLVTTPGARVCVRVHRDTDGNVLTKDTLPAFESTRRNLLQRWALLAASWLGLSTAVGCNRVLNMIMPLQGDVCPPPNSPNSPKGPQAQGSGSKPVVGNLRPSGSASTPYTYVPPPAPPKPSAGR